jgi:hypothetical protein
MGIISTNVIAAVALQSLESCPYICLNLFHQVTEMDRPVGVGQGAGDKNFSLRAHEFSE